MTVDHFTRPRPMAGNREKHNARTEGKPLHSNAEYPGSCKLKSPVLKILCLLPSRTCYLNKTHSFVGCYSLGKAMGLIDKVVKKLRHPKKPFNLPLPQILGPRDELLFHGLFCIFSILYFKAYCTPAKAQTSESILGAMNSLDSTLSHRRWSGLSWGVCRNLKQWSTVVKSPCAHVSSVSEF